MRELFEFVMGIMGALAFASLTVGAMVLAGFGLVFGSGWLCWRMWRRRPRK